MLYIKDNSGKYCRADESDVIFEATSIYNSYFCKGTKLTTVLTHVILRPVYPGLPSTLKNIFSF